MFKWKITLVATTVSLNMCPDFSWAQTNESHQPSNSAINQPAFCLTPNATNGSDICAQWVSANAARKSAEIAEISLKWTIASFLALIFTLFATSWAAIASALSARAAIKANKINQSANIIDQRAWLDVKLIMLGDFEITPDGYIGTNVGAEIKNIGKTPALNIYTNIEMDCNAKYDASKQELDNFSTKSLKESTIYTRSLLPGQSYVRKWAPGQENINVSFNSHKPIFPSIRVCVTYETIFQDGKHQTAFSETVGCKTDGEIWRSITYEHCVFNAEDIILENDGAAVIT